MCSIDAHDKQQTSSVDDSSSGGGNVLPSNSTTKALVSLNATITFIHCWLKLFDHNYIEYSNMYIENMKGLFHNIPFQLPKPQSLK